MLVTLVLLIASLCQFKKQTWPSWSVIAFTAFGLACPFIIEAVYGAGDFEPMHYFVVLFTLLASVTTVISLRKKLPACTAWLPFTCAAGYWCILLFGEITAAV